MDVEAFIDKIKVEFALTIENLIGSACVCKAEKDVKWVSLLFLLK